MKQIKGSKRPNKIDYLTSNQIEYSNVMNRYYNDLEDYADELEKAIEVTRCCTELPNKMVIELSDEEMQIVSTDELIQMEKEAMEFDGFEGWIVKGKAAILK